VVLGLGGGKLWHYENEESKEGPLNVYFEL
jgi:hypothetical protein